MKNYWKANCKRILSRKIRIIITLLLFIALDALMIYSSKNQKWNSVTFMDTLQGCKTVLVVALGLIEFIFVYASDLKAKTMQTAIAMGVRRRHVILTKYFDLAFLTIVDLLILTASQLIVGAITGAPLQTYQIGDLLILIFMTWLSIQAYAGFAIIVTLLLQNSALGGLVYLIFATKQGYNVLSFLFNLKIIRSLQLSGYLLSPSLNKFQAQILTSNFDFLSFILIVFYIVIAFVLCLRVFHKKELNL